MTAKLLLESGKTPLLREGAGYRAVMITPGKGSSGTYSEAVLQRDAQIAFPPSTLAFVDHPTESNPTRSARNIIGTYPDGGHYEEGTGIVSKLVPLPHWADWVEAVAPHTGLSIYAMGESDIAGNVTALLPDTQNSVDLVAYPGRPGSGLSQIFESALAFTNTERTGTVLGERKVTKMTPEQEALLKETLTALKSFAAESITAAEKLAKETAAATAVAAEAVADRKALVAALEAVNKADLPETLRASLISQVESGTTEIAPLVEAAVKLVADIKAEAAKTAPVTTRTGHVVKESVSGTDNDAEFAALFGKAE